MTLKRCAISVSGMTRMRKFSNERSRKRSFSLTKDKDFVDLVARLGPPPSVIWLRCGNTSEARLKQILTDHLDEALGFLAAGEHLVEVQ